MTDAVGTANGSLESRRSADFLTRAGTQPSALVVEGEAGIGKTTFLLMLLERARERGFQVLSTRPTAADTVLAYAALADMLGDVDPAVLARLPEPQRLAIDRILLRATEDDLPIGQRAVAAGFVSVIEELARERPVLLAIDDFQWLDPSSAAVVSFAVGRVSGPVGVVGAVRVEAGADAASWLTTSIPDSLTRIRLDPMSPRELHDVMSRRLGQAFPRPIATRIHQISGGNPFYAIELGRAIATGAIRADTPLPGTLAELVRARLQSVDERSQDALLASACIAAPTVELLAAVLDSPPDEVIKVLEMAEDEGIVAFEGNLLRFTHPLLAHGVYTGASPSRRREMHRRAALMIDEPEVHARHLALAAVKGDQATLDSLDTAAELARVRGAPIAAAEFLELAMRLGGDTPDRQIQAAVHHFNAGEAGRARVLLNNIVERREPKSLRAGALRLLGLWALLDGSSREGAELLREALNDAGDDPTLRVQILVPLAHAQVNVRRLDDAANSIADAVRTAERIGQPQLLSQALAMHALVCFFLGDGLDEPALERALQLEDREAPITALLDTTVQSAVLMGGSGRLDKAHDEWLAIRRHGIERGEEIELMMFAFHSGLVEIWRGNFAECALIAQDVRERAVQLGGGDLPLALAPLLQSAVAAYVGQEFEARRDATEALAICHRCDSPFLVTVWPITTLAFLDVSLGNYDAALTTLKPLLCTLDTTSKATEIFVTPFLPDAVEALVQLGQLAEAEPLIDALERNGRRLSRPWMLALGGRCRAMLLAARGDLYAASVAVQRAMIEHDALPMPFERARTQLLLGQIQRRQRQKAVASSTLQDALGAFERLGTPLWAERARTELARVKVGPQQSVGLTASEQRVAELAASGLTNREISAMLFISPKTVGGNLARVYRKLGIHSRAQLGRHMGRLSGWQERAH
jgi:DNA-binding CsgD family transcriptional regulator